MSTVRITKENDKLIERYLSFYWYFFKEKKSKQEIINIVLKNSFNQRISKIEQADKMIRGEI